MRKYINDTIIAEQYGDFVNNAILMSGIKKKKIAEHIGVNKQTLSYKLHGKRPWRSAELIAIAECLEITMEELLGGGRV